MFLIYNPFNSHLKEEKVELKDCAIKMYFERTKEKKNKIKFISLLLLFKNFVKRVEHKLKI